MKFTLLIATVIISIKTHALTEDYILNAGLNPTVKTKTQPTKSEICEKYSQSLETETLCKKVTRSKTYIKTCLMNTKSEENQKFCLKAVNLVRKTIIKCQNSNSNEYLELKCLSKFEKNNNHGHTHDTTPCAGMTFGVEITCLKFQK